MRITKTPEERKAEMVAIASSLFARQGFVRTSVSEITDGAQVAKGLFYYYFATKDDMVRSVVEGYCAYLEADMEKIVSGEGTGRDKLSRLFSGEAWRTYFTQPLMNDLCLPPIEPEPFLHSLKGLKLQCPSAFFQCQAHSFSFLLLSVSPRCSTP